MGKSASVADPSSANSWTIDQVTAGQALALLRKAKRVLVPTHQNVDADALASAIALCVALEYVGVEAVPIVSDGNLPHSLTFLPFLERVLIYGRDDVPAFDTLCLVDSSDLRRIGTLQTDHPDWFDGSIPMVNIDHHVTNDRFGDIDIVFSGAASTSEIIAELIRTWGVPLSQPIAQCLLAGIYGDTLGLRTSATTSRTMRTAADLVDAGANPEPIVDGLFRVKPRSSVCLWENALREVEWTGTVIWTALTEQMFASCGAVPSEAEGLVNFLLGTEGSLIAAILFANESGWRVSLRSLPPDVDVAAIAAEFGGGGHPRAAGCTIVGGAEEKRRFLERVSERAIEMHDPQAYR
jgi:phosphoesterase RecJ-like protein